MEYPCGAAGGAGIRHACMPLPSANPERGRSTAICAIQKDLHVVFRRKACPLSLFAGDFQYPRPVVLWLLEFYYVKLKTSRMPQGMSVLIIRLLKNSRLRHRRHTLRRVGKGRGSPASGTERVERTGTWLGPGPVPGAGMQSAQSPYHKNGEGLSRQPWPAGFFISNFSEEASAWRRFLRSQ